MDWSSVHKMYCQTTPITKRLIDTCSEHEASPAQSFCTVSSTGQGWSLTSEDRTESVDVVTYQTMAVLVLAAQTGTATVSPVPVVKDSAKGGVSGLQQNCPMTHYIVGFDKYLIAGAWRGHRVVGFSVMKKFAGDSGTQLSHEANKE
ncbi:hypothetical protein Btru_024636 [Bulinus truncatus]|nr:hypothetical protein Btru_024636 [Bulinus truncatus]